MRIFFKNTDKMPELPFGTATFLRLAGKSPEYEGPHKLLDSPEHLHGCRVIGRANVSGTDVIAARTLIANIQSYGDRSLGARCYSPGFAFTFGQGPAAVDVLVCLQCRWVVFHGGEQSLSLAPTNDGLARLKQIYETMINQIPTPTL